MKHVIITFMNFISPTNFFESRKEQKDEVKPVIKEMLSTFDFYVDHIKQKGGLGRDGDRYGALLKGLNHDNFISIQQLANFLLSEIEKLTERPPKSGLSTSVIATFLDLQKTCGVIKTIVWKPYPAPGETLWGHTEKETAKMTPFLSNEGNHNMRMSACISDLSRPMNKLRTVDFPSLLSSKVDVDFQYQ